MFWRTSSNSHKDLVNSVCRGKHKERVIDAMLKVDRIHFAPSNPYFDSPQCLGHGQTISAPHMHASALDHLSDYLMPGEKALDVGCGSGYLTVCMALMTDVLSTSNPGTVIGLECVQSLVDLSIENVKKCNPDLLSCANFELKLSDGWKGDAANGPYKAIHVGACAEKIPDALLDQLANEGRMFIPVDTSGGYQNIVVVDKDKDGKITEHKLFGVSYVPLIHPKL